MSGDHPSADTPDARIAPPPNGLSTYAPSALAPHAYAAPAAAPLRAAGYAAPTRAAWPGFLRRELRAFHAEATRLLGLVQQDAPGIDPRGAGTYLPVSGGAHAAASAKERLAERLRAGARDALAAGGSAGRQLYDEAQYAMVALADDLFLAAKWDGSAAWAAEPLEAHLYGTWLAGDRVFEGIDALIAAPMVERRELATVYLAVLALGFRGRFRHVDGGVDILAGYRARLFEAAYGRPPAPDDPGAGRGFAAAYAASLPRRAPAVLPSRARWLAIFLIAVAAYLGGGYLVWARATAGVEREARCIQDLVQRRACDAPAGTADSVGGGRRA